MKELRTTQNGYGKMGFRAVLEENEMALTDNQILYKAIGYNYGGDVTRHADGTVSGYGYID
jgi:hypothetical protein